MKIKNEREITVLELNNYKHKLLDQKEAEIRQIKVTPPAFETLIGKICIRP